jgi:hypothetical protein
MGRSNEPQGYVFRGELVIRDQRRHIQEGDAILVQYGLTRAAAERPDAAWHAASSQPPARALWGAVVKPPKGSVGGLWVRLPGVVAPVRVTTNGPTSAITRQVRPL